MMDPSGLAARCTELRMMALANSGAGATSCPYTVTTHLRRRRVVVEGTGEGRPIPCHDHGSPARAEESACAEERAQEKENARHATAGPATGGGGGGGGRKPYTHVHPSMHTHTHRPPSPSARVAAAHTRPMGAEAAVTDRDTAAVTYTQWTCVVVPTPTESSHPLDCVHLLRAHVEAQRRALLQRRAHLPVPLLESGGPHGRPAVRRRTATWARPSPRTEGVGVMDGGAARPWGGQRTCLARPGPGGAVHVGMAASDAARARRQAARERALLEAVLEDPATHPRRTTWVGSRGGLTGGTPGEGGGGALRGEGREAPPRAAPLNDETHHGHPGGARMNSSVGSEGLTGGGPREVDHRAVSSPAPASLSRSPSPVGEVEVRAAPRRGHAEGRGRVTGAGESLYAARQRQLLQRLSEDLEDDEGAKEAAGPGSAAQAGGDSLERQGAAPTTAASPSPRPVDSASGSPAHTRTAPLPSPISPVLPPWAGRVHEHAASTAHDEAAMVTVSAALAVEETGDADDLTPNGFTGGDAVGIDEYGAVVYRPPGSPALFFASADRTAPTHPRLPPPSPSPDGGWAVEVGAATPASVHDAHGEPAEGGGRDDPEKRDAHDRRREGRRALHARAQQPTAPRRTSGHDVSPTTHAHLRGSVRSGGRLGSPCELAPAGSRVRQRLLLGGVSYTSEDSVGRDSVRTCSSDGADRSGASATTTTTTTTAATTTPAVVVVGGEAETSRQSRPALAWTTPLSPTALSDAAAGGEAGVATAPTARASPYETASLFQLYSAPEWGGVRAEAHHPHHPLHNPRRPPHPPPPSQPSLRHSTAHPEPLARWPSAGERSDPAGTGTAEVVMEGNHGRRIRGAPPHGVVEERTSSTTTTTTTTLSAAALALATTAAEMDGRPSALLSPPLSGEGGGRGDSVQRRGDPWWAGEGGGQPPTPATRAWAPRKQSRRSSSSFYRPSGGGWAAESSLAVAAAAAHAMSTPIRTASLVLSTMSGFGGAAPRRTWGRRSDSVARRSSYASRGSGGGSAVFAVALDRAFAAALRPSPSLSMPSTNTAGAYALSASPERDDGAAAGEGECAAPTRGAHTLLGEEVGVVAPEALHVWGELTAPPHVRGPGRVWAGVAPCQPPHTPLPLPPTTSTRTGPDPRGVEEGGEDGSDEKHGGLHAGEPPDGRRLSFPTPSPTGPGRRPPPRTSLSVALAALLLRSPATPDAGEGGVRSSGGAGARLSELMHHHLAYMTGGRWGGQQTPRTGPTSVGRVSSASSGGAGGCGQHDPLPEDGVSGCVPPDDARAVWRPVHTSPMTDTERDVCGSGAVTGFSSSSPVRLATTTATTTTAPTLPCTPLVRAIFAQSVSRSGSRRAGPEPSTRAGGAETGDPPQGGLLGRTPAPAVWQGDELDGHDARPAGVVTGSGSHTRSQSPPLATAGRPEVLDRTAKPHHPPDPASAGEDRGRGASTEESRSATSAASCVGRRAVVLRSVSTSVTAVTRDSVSPDADPGGAAAGCAGRDVSSSSAAGGGAVSGSPSPARQPSAPAGVAAAAAPPVQGDAHSVAAPPGVDPTPLPRSNAAGAGPIAHPQPSPSLTHRTAPHLDGGPLKLSLSAASSSVDPPRREKVGRWRASGLGGVGPDGGVSDGYEAVNLK